MNGLLHIKRKGEAWHEYNFTYGVGFMRSEGYTKGFCRECGKWKLFHLDNVQPRFQVLHVFGSAHPFVENHGADYYGTCTNGHSGLLSPWTRTEQKDWKRDATRLNDLHGSRGILAKRYYLAWREMFRRPDKETHYAPDHQCDGRCPEYKRDYEEW
jgi:hypothetical protein